jgi:L-threonylcarbamoyladenylate synthase
MKILIPTDKNITLAASALRAGDLVAIPTETVYGLAADAHNDSAIKKIYDTKGRPENNPLIIHVADFDSAMQYGELNGHARALASVFWPGPLTLVVKRNKGSDTANNLAACFGRLDTLALRVPAHPIAQALLKNYGQAIAAPSANLSGRLSPTQANHVADAFAGFDQPKIILAGGRADAGLESTIVDCTGDVPHILRPGSMTLEQLQSAVPKTTAFAAQKVTNDKAMPAPGMLTQHYAPRTPLRLNVAEIFADEALLAFGTEPLWSRRAVQILNLSPSGDLAEAAHQLFSHLHMLDAAGARRIAVMPIPNEGIGIAINDRLHRGASN